MRRRTVTLFSGVAVLVGGTVGTLVPGAIAGAKANSAIGSDQTFVGLVNGSRTDATIVVACPEAQRPGEMGNPVSGQTVAVRSPAPSTSPSGATGTRAKKIIAQFPTPSAVAAPSVIFSRYGSQPIPTTLLLPCFGSGTVVFSPSPTSATARSESLTVTFVWPCVGTCAAGRHPR
jgi:hypothetical protein